jgi:DNA polymerase V
LDTIYKEGYRYKKTGVIVMDIVPDSQVQAGLFDSLDRKRDKRLMKALDGVNTAFGADLVRFAAQGYSKEWHLRCQKKSRRFTTNIGEIIQIES